MYALTMEKNPEGNFKMLEGLQLMKFLNKIENNVYRNKPMYRVYISDFLM